MFDQDQELVSHLLKESNDFRRLYEKHSDLKKTVQQAHEGDIGIDEFELEHLKKEKLLLKDRMAEIIENYRQH
ncbi:MAG: DUF465 domain-containing protein [Gammaproteobacteria bacterium]